MKNLMLSIIVFWLGAPVASFTTADARILVTCPSFNVGDHFRAGVRSNTSIVFLEGLATKSARGKQTELESGKEQEGQQGPPRAAGPPGQKGDPGPQVSPGVVRVFDSGFVAASIASSLSFTHDLGTTRLLVKVYYSEDASGVEMEEVVADTSGGTFVARWIGAFVKSITPTTLKVQTGGLGITRFNGGVRARGFLRVIAVALP